MVKAKENNTNIKVAVQTTGNKSVSATAQPTVVNSSVETTNNLAKYYADLSKEYAIGDDIVQGKDRSSKYHANMSAVSANEAKYYANIAENTSNNVQEFANDAIGNIENIENSAINNIEVVENDAIENITTTTTNAKDESLQAIQDKREEAISDIATKARALPMFTPIWSDHILNDASYLRADTFSWHNGDIYTTAYNVLLNEFNSDKSIEELEGNVTYKRTPSGFKIADIAQHENILTTFTMTGKSWFYVLDTAQQRFKLPRTQYSFTGIRDTVGGDVKAGLPSLSLNSTGAHTHTRGTMNITGQAGFTDMRSSPTSTGAFYFTGSSGSQEGGGKASTNPDLAFDASRSWTGATSSNGAHSHTITDSAGVLGKSNTVQPSATQMYLYFFVGNYTRPQSDIDIGELVELINERDFEGQVADGKQELTTTKNNCIKEINNNSVGNRVIKTGDTMTGTLYIKPKTNVPLVLLSDNVDKTQAPETNTGIQLCMRDKNSQLVGLLEQWNFTTGEKRMTMRALNSISGTEKTGQITVSVDADGNAFTSAPTPATGDNSTKIATTAYCVNMRCTSKATTTSSASTTRPCWVVQNYLSGGSWYRVWSDGWIEQGGISSAVADKAGITVSFLKSFANTNYDLQVTSIWQGTNDDTTWMQSYQIRQDSLKNNSFYVYSRSSTQKVFRWYACGY